MVTFYKDSDTDPDLSRSRIRSKSFGSAILLAPAPAICNMKIWAWKWALSSHRSPVEEEEVSAWAGVLHSILYEVHNGIALELGEATKAEVA